MLDGEPICRPTERLQRSPRERVFNEIDFLSSQIPNFLRQQAHVTGARCPLHGLGLANLVGHSRWRLAS